jgi:hypothetical protein
MSIKAIAVIRKVGNQYCVFSKDGKNLGCHDSEKDAKQRLKQIEFFKRQKSMSVGTIAGRQSNKILDTREHFPIATENQARSAIKRIGQIQQLPAWFNGTIDDLRKIVYLGVAEKYPEIRIPIDLHLEAAMARLVCAQKGSVMRLHSKSNRADAINTLKQEVVIKNPEDNPTKVPGIPRKSIQSVAKTLVEIIEDRKAALKTAEKVAKRLEQDGISGEEFKQLISFLQEDILRELLHMGVLASYNENAMKRVIKNRRTG